MARKKIKYFVFLGGTICNKPLIFKSLYDLFLHFSVLFCIPTFDLSLEYGGIDKRFDCPYYYLIHKKRALVIVREGVYNEK